jgi:hypothetical protein
MCGHVWQASIKVRAPSQRMSSMVGEASAVMLWFMGKPYRDRRNTFLIGALVSRNRTSFSLEIFMCEQCARRFSAREGGRAGSVDRCRSALQAV